MEFEIGDCINCNKEIIVESKIRICLHCAAEIIAGIRFYEKKLKIKPVLDVGKDWYFSFEGIGEEYQYVAFSKIYLWEKEGVFCEYHRLDEDEQGFIDYITGEEMASSDECNFELNGITVEDARKKFLELGMVELFDDNQY